MNERRCRHWAIAAVINRSGANIHGNDGSQAEREWSRCPYSGTNQYDLNSQRILHISNSSEKHHHIKATVCRENAFDNND